MWRQLFLGRLEDAEPQPRPEPPDVGTSEIPENGPGTFPPRGLSQAGTANRSGGFIPGVSARAEGSSAEPGEIIAHQALTSHLSVSIKRRRQMAPLPAPGPPLPMDSSVPTGLVLPF